MKKKIKTITRSDVYCGIDRGIYEALSDQDFQITYDVIELRSGKFVITATLSIMMYYLDDDSMVTFDLGTFTTFAALNRTIRDTLIKFFRSRDPNEIGADMVTQIVHLFDAEENEMDGEAFSEIVTSLATLSKRFDAAACALETQRNENAVPAHQAA